MLRFYIRRSAYVVVSAYMTLMVARFPAYGATLDTLRHEARIFAERNVVGSTLTSDLEIRSVHLNNVCDRSSLVQAPCRNRGLNGIFSRSG